MNRFDSKTMVVVAFLGLVGCDYSVQGGFDAGTSGNSVVSAGGVTLTPKSALGLKSTHPQAPYALVGILTEQPAFCAASSGCSTRSLDPAGGRLLFGLVSTSLGEHQVGPKGAVLEFGAGATDGGAPVRLGASNGTIRLDAYTAPGTARGRYDVSLSSGEVLSGTFDLTACPGLALNEAFGGTRCSYSNDGGSCTGECACEGATMRSACRKVNSAQWSCTCTAAGGEVTTCTGYSQSSASIAACLPPSASSDASCCPMF